MAQPILFINSLESDYLQDIVAAGFQEPSVLPPTEFVCWPFHFQYFYPQKEYPRNLGSIQKPNFGLLQVPHRLQWTFQKSSFPFRSVIVAAAKPDCFRGYLKIQKLIPQHVPIVFVDGGDRPEIGGDLERLGAYELFQEAQKNRPFDFIFKREYLLRDQHPDHVRPMPFGMNLRHFENLKDHGKKYQVSFWAVESDPIRTQALQLLQNKFDCKQNGTHLKQIFKKYKRKGKYYLEELKSCQIVLNFRGVGWDTLRYWEVPALNTFMISGRPQIQIPNGFVDGEDMVYCQDDLSDLIELCEYYLKNPEKRQQMAARALQKVHQFHSHIHRAQEILKLLPN
jgi:hypothetical protein